MGNGGISPHILNLAAEWGHWTVLTPGSLASLPMNSVAGLLCRCNQIDLSERILLQCSLWKMPQNWDIFTGTVPYRMPVCVARCICVLSYKHTENVEENNNVFVRSAELLLLVSWTMSCSYIICACLWCGLPLLRLEWEFRSMLALLVEA
jgi:hypothetical protein